MSGKRLTSSDAMFLYMETRETMMHVSSLLPFSPPPDAPPDYLRRLMDEIRANPVVHRPFNLKLRTPELLVNPLQAWVDDRDIDLEYHVRRSALPTPGDERELGILVSRLHGQEVDFHRPPWEVHLIEGLERGRFALYVKVHHALVDGYSAMKILASSLSRDPNDRARPLFFSIPPPERAPRDGEAAGLHFPELMAAVRAQVGTSRSVVKALLNMARSSRTEGAGVAAAGADVDLEPAHLAQPPLRHAVVRRGAHARGGQGGQRHPERRDPRALRRRRCASTSRELDALPAAPLVAMVPVNVRPKDDAGGGNAVGAILASLATDVADPSERFDAIIASTRRAKEQLQGMSKDAIIQYSALLTSPFMLQLLPGAMGRVRPAFNLVISNVPGPEEPLYFRGARLEAAYPMSIPVHGLALNITCNSYAGTINFGFIGCRDTLPHLQRLAVHAGEALDELERAVLSGGFDGSRR